MNEGSRLSRRALLRGLATAGTIGVAGCNGLSEDGPEAVDPLWRREFEGAWGASPPAITGGPVLVGGQDKSLHALDPADGTTVFSLDTGGPVEQRPVAPAEGGPYHVHSTDGDLYTLDTDGNRLWTVEGQKADGVIGRAGSLLVVDDPRTESVRGLDPMTGEERFRYGASPYRYPGLTPELFALFVRGGASEARLVVLNHDGSVRWEIDPAPQYASPVVAGDSLYLGVNPTVTAHAASDGHVRWEADVGSERSPIEQITPGADLYVQRERKDRVELLALDHESGEVRWKRRSKGYLTGRVVPTADAVYLVTPVDDPDGGIVARAERFALDGTREWGRPTSLPVGGHIEGALHTDGLLCLQNDRELLGLDPETGEARWRFDTDGSRIGVAAESDALYVSLLNSGTVARLPTG